MKSAAFTVQGQDVAEVIAVLISIIDDYPHVLTIRQGSMLPNGPLQAEQSSLQSGVRRWVTSQIHYPLDYLEQLYTFIDTERRTQSGHFLLEVSYLGLLRKQKHYLTGAVRWMNWYDYFPWEDRRNKQHHLIEKNILPHLNVWINDEQDPHKRYLKKQRMAMCWGLEPFTWNEEHTLQRYEMLYEAGLVAESPFFQQELAQTPNGKSMHYHHRRILATAMTRLRAKIKYRPVIVELLPNQFTLFTLQQHVESLAGQELHKQNFRRLIMNQQLLEETGKISLLDRGRPAKLYRFRENILLEHIAKNSRLPISRN